MVFCPQIVILSYYQGCECPSKENVEIPAIIQYAQCNPTCIQYLRMQCIHTIELQYAEPYRLWQYMYHDLFHNCLQPQHTYKYT